jgi:hypothetical protein
MTLPSMPESGGAHTAGSLADRVDLLAQLPWKIAPRETCEDGSKYPAHIVAGELEYTVCYLEADIVAQKFPETDFTTRPHALAIAALPALLHALSEAQKWMTIDSDEASATRDLIDAALAAAQVQP